MYSFNSEHGNKKYSKTEQDQKKKKKNPARPKARRDMVGVLNIWDTAMTKRNCLFYVSSKTE